MTNPSPIAPLTARTQRTTRRRLFVRDLVLPCHIGVWAHEKGRAQRVRVSVEVDLDLDPPAHGDTLANVLSYDAIVDGVRRLTGAGHINLVETLAEQIADLCLADPRARRVWARVEKIDVIAEASGVGFEIERLSE